jgi:UDP-N-acetylmuramate dehydrogenase
LEEALRARLGARVRFREPLARYTSMRVGGPADALVRAESVPDVQATLEVAARHDVPLFVLGGGTNVLVSDLGVRGIVLVLSRGFDYARWTLEDGAALVAAGAAVRVGRLVRRVVAAGLGGVESAEGIPGTVGGGLLMNAGAYGVELGSVVESVSGVRADGTPCVLGRDVLRFGYRQADLPPGMVATEVRLRLRPDEPGVLRERMLEARRSRLRSQPQGYPTAGSTFKNPPGDHAARLIEMAGLKGARLGGAQISDRHANFFVNLGDARAAEIRALMDLAQRTVWERFRVWLEPEVRLVGKW